MGKAGEKMRAEYYYYSAGGIDVALSNRSGSITERRFVFYSLREVKEILRAEGVRNVTHMKKLDYGKLASLLA